MSYGHGINWLLWCPKCGTEHPVKQRKPAFFPFCHPEDSTMTAPMADVEGKKDPS